MLILTCFIILKYWWHKYRWLSAILVVVILLLFFLINKINNYYNNINKDIIEEWVNLEDFSNKLDMNKEWKLQSYPMISILSDIDGEIQTINIVTWDIVQQYDILMQIKNRDLLSFDYYDVWENIEDMYKEYDEIEKQYNEFKMENWNKIKWLEYELFDKNNALIHAIEFNDKESIKILEKEIDNLSTEYKKLKIQQDELESMINSLDNEIKIILNKSDKYYYELEKQIPRSPLKWVISNIYVWEWDEVKNWDILVSIINNNYTPEISVNLDFNEYLLTKELTWVTIIIENENWWNFLYNWEIYTRSPILNEEEKYAVTIKILWEVSDLILSDKNTKITVSFVIDSDFLWIPSNCFKKIWNTNWILTLREWNIIQEKEVWIKSKWNLWNNVENFVLYSLENKREKYWIELLCYIE